MLKNIKEFLNDMMGFVGKGLVYAGTGLAALGLVIGALAIGFGIIALVMMIPAGILWYLLPFFGYAFEFWKIWAAVIILRVIGGLLFNHSSIKIDKD